jgi:hypothetical protein
MEELIKIICLDLSKKSNINVEYTIERLNTEKYFKGGIDFRLILNGVKTKIIINGELLENLVKNTKQYNQLINTMLNEIKFYF